MQAGPFRMEVIQAADHNRHVIMNLIALIPDNLLQQIIRQFLGIITFKLLD
ncbi:hypothetical protein D3C86_2146790 [compost metagenome]